MRLPFASGSNPTEGCEIADEAIGESSGLRLLDDALVRHALASEFAQICRTPIDGMFVSPSASETFKWFGLIFIRKGIYGGGIFRFVLNIPTDFPNTSGLPDVVFDNSIFHPLIDWKTRKLDLTRSFPDGWKREKHSLLRVLIVVQRIFFSYEFDVDRCINPEASILYKEHRDKFREMAKDVVETSRAQVYDDPPDAGDSNYIRLTPWDGSVHEATREQMMLIGSGQRASPASSGGKSRLTNATASEYRRDIDARERGALTDVLGKNFPRSFSWFDPDQMTVLTQEVNGQEAQPDLTSARLDREKHGIEPLDLTSISGDSPINSPTTTSGVENEKLNGDQHLNTATIEMENLKIDESPRDSDQTRENRLEAQSEESVI